MLPLLMQGTEAPALSTNAAVILTAPSFLSSYATETANFINAVNNLPATNPGNSDATVSALGERRPLSSAPGMLHRACSAVCH